MVGPYIPAVMAASLLASVPAASPAPVPVRREAFSEVWTLVRDQFFDPRLRGVDWEAARRTWGPRAARAGSVEALADAINGMLAELGTSHTHFYTVLDPEYWFLADLFDRPPESGTRGHAGIGVFVSEIDGQTFVRSVVDGGPAARAGLRSGDRIVSVDGDAWQPVRSFEAKEAKAVVLCIERTKDPEDLRDITVVPERIHPVEFYQAALRASAKVVRWGGISVAYVRVWSYAGKQNQDTLIDLLTGSLAGADGLVLDLRDGWGGADPSYLNLFHHGIPRMTSIPRDGVEKTYDSQWRKPVVLLVDENTRSGKEIFAYGFQRYGHGPIVGATTAGAVVAGKTFPIGNDGLLYLAVTDIRVDGERLEGRGVTPDHVVPFTLPYSAGSDPRLERALEVLRDLVHEKS